MTQREGERASMKENEQELAPPVKYNITQAVLHLERCHTRLSHQAMTSSNKKQSIYTFNWILQCHIHVSKHKKCMTPIPKLILNKKKKKKSF